MRVGAMTACSPYVDERGREHRQETQDSHER
jgi:hypothetical protein